MEIVKTIENSNIAQRVCQITVGIPTYKRLDKLVTTLRKILTCNPIPAEIIIHIDAGDTETEAVITKEFPQIRIIKSETRVGPGGGRNKIIGQASHSIIASFDDDSYPIDTDYFEQLLNMFAQYPKAAVVAAQIYHVGEKIKENVEEANFWVASFTGCGCAYQREAFLETSGYLPLPVAYGMEEVDLSLRLYCAGWKILDTHRLRVFHDTQLTHHARAEITAGSIANLALLAYLRYPFTYWGYGLLQYGNRIVWLIKNKRINGIGQGIFQTPQLLIKHRHCRQPLTGQCLAHYFAFRKEAIPAVSDAD